MQDNIKKGTNALDLFPDVFGSEEPETPDFEIIQDPERARERSVVLPEAEITRVQPPRPPDVGWLPNGLQDDDGEASSLGRSALLLISGSGKRALVASKLLEFGFEITEVSSGEDAIEEVKGADYSLVVCDIEDAVPEFHEYLSWLPMAKRRTMYYTLIGTSLHTLYALEAISYSANMVVNDRDIHHLAKILTKGFTDYEKTYGPYLEELHINSPHLS